MAEKNLVALLDTAARTIHVCYQQGADSNSYTYVTDDKDIKVGDFVVVPTATKGVPPAQVVEALKPLRSRVAQGVRLSIAYVVRVDDTVNIEPDSDIYYHWAVGKVDMASHFEKLAKHDQIETAVQEVYKANLRQSFADRILGSLPNQDRDRILALMQG